MTPLQFCNEDVDIHYAHQYPEVSLNNDILSLRFYNQGELIAFIFIKCHIKEDIDYMHFIKMFHTNLQKSIENTRLNSDIIDVQKQLIQSLAEICESKSAQTGQHIKRVGEYMKVMAKVQGLDDHMCETLCMAAMLHDVGKLRISDEILEKKGGQNYAYLLSLRLMRTRRGTARARCDRRGEIGARLLDGRRAQRYNISR